MEGLPGKVSYTYQGNVVDSLLDLPTTDYQKIQQQLFHWRRRLASEVIYHQLQERGLASTIKLTWQDKE